MLSLTPLSLICDFTIYFYSVWAWTMTCQVICSVIPFISLKKERLKCYLRQNSPQTQRLKFLDPSLNYCLQFSPLNCLALILKLSFLFLFLFFLYILFPSTEWLAFTNCYVLWICKLHFLCSLVHVTFQRSDHVVLVAVNYTDRKWWIN